MTIEIKVPVLPESVTDATVSKWYKGVGDSVSRDDNLVDLETDKVMLEVPAPRSGVIKEIKIEEGTTVNAGQLLAIIDDAAAAAEKSAEKPAEKPVEKKATAPQLSASAGHAESATGSAAGSVPAQHQSLSPSARRAAGETGVDASHLAGSGKDGRVTKQDVAAAARNGQAAAPVVGSAASAPMQAMAGQRMEKRVPMSRLRSRIAERLVQVQHSAAILTTFNEINMKPVMDLRKQYKDQFEKTHGVRLGFMSFFTKAVIEALKRFPAVNASLDGQDVIYHDYYDVGIAIGGPRGLVVPIIRNAEMLSMAGIEKAIREYAGRVKDNKLTIDEMTGGTFTITNGGTYGSMMSTPIINPPQSGILGMHNIVERPVVENGEVVIRPMMYVALSYDHRIIDGSESVRFLVTIKELLEDPARLILEV